MNATSCISGHLNELQDAIALFGRNKSKIPLGIAWHNDTDKWWIYVDVNSAKATFDIETSNASLDAALIAAAIRVKREAHIVGAAA